MRRRRLITLLMVCLTGLAAGGQTFTLQAQGDSAAMLRLDTPEGCDIWQLPYPTFAFATGDVNGDGVEDALVGVVKSTRFDPRPARRLFVFQQVHGHVRPLWLGSRLTGDLHAFRLCGQQLLTLERDADSLWFVGNYRWDSFGFVMTGSAVQHAERLKADSVLKHSIPNAKR